VTKSIRIVAFGFRALEGTEGGIETHARELYRRIAALSCDITVLTRSRYDTRAQPCTVYRTKPIWAPTGNGLETAVHSLFCVAYCAWMRPDVVHLHGIGPGVWAGLLRLAGLRVVLTHHGHDYDAAKWGYWARALLRIAEQLGVRHANEVICVSDAIRHGVAGLNARTRTIRNGAPRDIDSLRRPASTALAALAPRSYVLVVGRLTAHKRVLDVVTAVSSAALRELSVVVCGGLGGSDPYIEAVRAAARQNPNVLLAGAVDRAELPWLYRHALCTVMASSYEGMPLAVLEALGCESTVLLSDLPAHREIGLPDEHYFPVGGVAALRAKIEKLMCDAAARDRLARPAVLDARFDWNVIARASATVFGDALAGGAGPATVADPSIRSR
jgi:glycosyltransferase involved in cell wall biosynthesis